jgi:hypothetical protein
MPRSKPIRSAKGKVANIKAAATAPEINPKIKTVFFIRGAPVRRDKPAGCIE